VHVEASTGFSIFLSGFLVKTALFCFINFYYLFVTYYMYVISISLAIFGCMDSSLRMLSSSDIKRLVAYTTIQEMNLLMLFIMLNCDSSYNIIGMFVFFHGLLSTILFCIVDVIQKKNFTRNLVTLSGLSIFLPRLTFFIWFSLLAFRGFPFFIKFVVE
jgi:NADH:ubiquinone oxidoreductase subunit 4 (subunit M)